MRDDLHFLLHAHRMAQRGLGRTWPNPSVGCVLVKDGHVLAAARTADGGRPHAETRALAVAGATARGATAYVTLEPCAHHGQTPPCAQALIAAGVARVVIGCVDPDARVNGQGAAMLRAAGMDVAFLDMPEAARLHRGFFRRTHDHLPYVAMKLATSLDNCIADRTGTSQWITSAQARIHGHQLRGQHDGILTGIGTVLADDPQLTVRAPNPANSHLVRVVADRHLRLPLTSTLVKTARTQPTWVITGVETVEHNASHATELREAGVVLHAVTDGALAPATILTTLAAAGITRVLVEAGAQLSTAFVAAGMVETLHWYRAPLLLGNTGKPSLAALHSTLKDAHRHAVIETRRLGVDTYERIELH